MKKIMKKENHRHGVKQICIDKILEQLKNSRSTGNFPSEKQKKEAIDPYENPVKVIGKGYDDTTKKNDAKLKRKLKREMNKKDTPACNNLISTLEESDSFFK